MVHNILYYIVKEILKRTLVRMLICCVIALLFCITGNAKVPYIPKIINYSVSDYKAGNQNWAVSQGPGGKMYIGNNRGLLVFDGIHWDLVKLPNNPGVRALYISKAGRIYVGSFEEFFSSRRRHTRCLRDWSSDVCSSDLMVLYRKVIS